MSRSCAVRKFSTIIVLAAAGTLIAHPCQSRGDDDDFRFVHNTTSLGQHSSDGYITTDQLLDLGTPTVDSLKLTGEQFERSGNIDKAIINFQKAVELDPKAIDTRVVYAQALEKKLRQQTNRDPKLFNFVIKQWLFVFQKAEFLDEKQTAAGHLNELTGITPMRFERAKAYLSKVLMPEDGSEAVAFGKRIKPEAQ